MRLFRLLFLGLFVAFAAYSIGQFIDQDEPVTSGEHDDRKHAPSDEFFLQRSFPDERFDIVKYTRVIEGINSRVQARSGAPDGFDRTWTTQGPGNIGGRANTLAFHPFKENIIYAGFASSGVFKTINGGKSWKAIFDDQPFLAIGDIAIDPQKPNTLYVGTGDPNISGTPFIGNGLFKSDDAGETWEHLGLEECRIISKVIVDPNNSDILYVSSMGLPFERGPNRGLYKSTNGGKDWERVLFISDQAGVIDFLLNPEDPNVLYAAGWDRIRNNRESILSGPGAKIYKTEDGGETWTTLSGGLPEGNNYSRLGLEMSRQDPNILYALYIHYDGSWNHKGIYRTDNAGVKWGRVPTDEDQNGLSALALGGFGWYFGQMRIHPQDDDDLFLPGVHLWRSQNCGATWFRATPFSWEANPVHVDIHDLQINESGHIYLATDGGLYKSVDDGETWQDIDNIPSTQFYRTAYNPNRPDWYYGGAQDNGTLGGRVEQLNDWKMFFGGDGFQTLFHPYDEQIIYVELQRGNFFLSFDGGENWQTANQGIYNGDRTNWDAPFLMSYHDPDVLYTGTYRVYKSNRPGAPDWFITSPDLTAGTSSQFRTISAMDESTARANLLYAGTSDGRLWISQNGALDWEDISAGLPQRYITSVKASPVEEGHVYVSHSGYRDNEYIPHLHRSMDYGATWVDISGDLPEIAVNDVYILPMNQDSVLFAATDAGVYATLNRGEAWYRLGGNMPIVPVFDLGYNPDRNELVAATHGRALMTFALDSIGLDADNLVDIPPRRNTYQYIKVSPNPTPDAILVSFTNLDPSQLVDIEILDIQGRSLIVQKGLAGKFIAERLDLSSLAAGQYFVKIIMLDQVFAEAFIKI
ncbi:MAG: T9SS type A sorting domain-containing protein [Bacteroidota bacterium]